LVLPAFNEEAAIGSALSAIRAYLDEQSYAYQVIVAADGTDATPDVVKSIATEWPSLELTFERGRHGKGYGLRQGMRMAQGEIVGFMDADYKVPIGEMEKLLPWFNDGFDLVIGSRALSDSLIERQQPWFRQIGSRAFGLLMHALVGLNQIQDTQCGFKFFTRQAAQDIFALTRIDGYMCDVEILWLAEKLGYPVKETGIVWRDDGDTRLQLVAGNIRNARDLLRIRSGSYTDAGAVRAGASRPVMPPR